MSTKRNRQSVQENRRNKKSGYSRSEVQSEKHQEERKKNIIPLVAKNNNQKKALKFMTEKQLILLLGSSGAGKSELGGWWASKRWLSNEVSNIVITRPSVGHGNTPATPGNDVTKLLSFVMSILQKLKKYLGAGVLKNNLRTEDFDPLFNDVDGIQVVATEKLQGLSFPSSTVVIADEMQNSTVAQMKSLVTRMEEGAQLIVCGDEKQTALKGKNGLTWLREKVQNNPHEDIGIVNFTPDDCCRLGISKHFTHIIEDEEGGW